MKKVKTLSEQIKSIVKPSKAPKEEENLEFVDINKEIEKMLIESFNKGSRARIPE